MGILSSIAGGLGNIFSSVGSGIMGAIDTVLDAGSSLLSGIGDMFGMSDVFGGATEAAGTAGAAGGSGLDAVANSIADSATSFADVGEALGSGIPTNLDILDKATSLGGGLMSTMDEGSSLLEAASSASQGVLSNVTQSPITQTLTKAAEPGLWDKVVDFAKTPAGGKILGTAATAGILGGLQWMMAGQQQAAAEEQAEKNREFQAEEAEKTRQFSLDKMQRERELAEELYKAKKMGALNAPPPVSVLPSGQVITAPRPNAVIPQLQLNPNPTVNS